MRNFDPRDAPNGYIAVEDVDLRGCSACVFLVDGYISCCDVPCEPSERSDKKLSYFIRDQDETLGNL